MLKKKRYQPVEGTDLVSCPLSLNHYRKNQDLGIPSLPDIYAQVFQCTLLAHLIPESIPHVLGILTVKHTYMLNLNTSKRLCISIALFKCYVRLQAP